MSTILHRILDHTKKSANMIPPPKYTPRAQEEEEEEEVGSFNQHVDNNDIFADYSNREIGAPPPAYCRQANQPPPFPQAAEPNPQEQRNIANNRLLVPRIPSHLERAYPSRPHRANRPYRSANPFVQDVRAWNAHQVLQLNNHSNSNSSGGDVRVDSPRRAPRAPVPQRGGGYRSGGGVENYGLDGRPLESPKFACESEPCVFFFYLSYSILERRGDVHERSSRADFLSVAVSLYTARAGV
jgi:hypothetical protein